MAAVRLLPLGWATLFSAFVALLSDPIVGVSALLLYILFRGKSHPVGSPRRHANFATSLMALLIPAAVWTNLSSSYRSIDTYSGNWENLPDYMAALGAFIIPMQPLTYVTVFVSSYLISKSKKIITSSGGRNKSHRGGILSKASNLDISESKVFLQAKNEIGNDTRDEGIWAMAYSSTANEEEAKKLYIKLRVEKIYEDSVKEKGIGKENNEKVSFLGGLIISILTVIGYSFLIVFIIIIMALIFEAT